MSPENYVGIQLNCIPDYREQNCFSTMWQRDNYILYINVISVAVYLYTNLMLRRPRDKVHTSGDVIWAFFHFPIKLQLVKNPGNSCMYSPISAVEVLSGVSVATSLFPVTLWMLLNNQSSKTNLLELSV